MVESKEDDKNYKVIETRKIVKTKKVIEVKRDNKK